MTEAADILAGRDIVVTGATGYIGTHFVAALTAAGMRPHVLGRPDLTQARLAETPALAASLPDVRVLEHDGSVTGIAEALSALSDPVVVHLAGLFVSLHQPEDVARLVASNVGFSAMLFDAMRLAQCKSIVSAGTLWEHGTDGAYAPVNLYAATKHAAEQLLDYYVRSEGFGAVTIKLLDTYGRNDPRPKLLPLLRKSLETGTALDMSSGHQPIYLTHVDDICTALLASAAMATESGSQHAVVSTLSEEPHSIREVVGLIEDVSERSLHVNWGARPDAAQMPQAPWSGASRPKGWRACVSLREGLKRYVTGDEPPAEAVFGV